MQLDRCAKLPRLSLEGFLKREEPTLRGLRPPRLPQRVLANLECLQTSALAESRCPDVHCTSVVYTMFVYTESVEGLDDEEHHVEC